LTEIILNCDTTSHTGEHNLVNGTSKVRQKWHFWNLSFFYPSCLHFAVLVAIISLSM